MTVIFVTHSISEAVYLSTRVVVLSPRPGRLAEIIDIDLPRPRGPETRDLDQFFHLSNQVRHALRGGQAGEISEAGRRWNERRYAECDTLKLTQHQASDVEAASDAIYSEAADEELVFDNRTLGRDLLALALLFFVIVTYHSKIRC